MRFSISSVKSPAGKCGQSVSYRRQPAAILNPGYSIIRGKQAVYLRNYAEANLRETENGPHESTVEQPDINTCVSLIFLLL